jgi:hydrogenase/urease accessory protein HupE
MKSTSRRSLSLFAVFSVAAAIAQAHPGHTGHEGGDFTWDFSHLTAHPFATLAFVALAGAAGWAAWSHFRSRRTLPAHSLRKSTANR